MQIKNFFFNTALVLFLTGSSIAQTDNKPTTIVVLNFSNRGTITQWQWLCKGLADMLITDLSKCEQLQVVERERMQTLYDEMQLSNSGIIEVSAGVQIARVAKVDKAIFGSFVKNGDNIEIEAHIIDITTEKLIRIERTEDKAGDVIQLVKQLSFKLIDNLNVPITEAEKESIRYVPTDSISAVEHFYNGLNHYDRGEYYDAYIEFQKAVKSDKHYIEAMQWIGNIYSMLGKYKHAAIEYEEILYNYPEHKLAQDVLFKLARLYEKKLDSNKLAIKSYEKLVNTYGKNSHALTSQYRLARFKELSDSSSLIDVYLSYQAVSNHPVTAFREGQHDLAHIAYLKALIYYIAIFNQFGGTPPGVKGVVVLSDESPTFCRNFATGEGENNRTGSWGYYNSIQEGYIFKAPEGYAFKELIIEMTRSPSEKKRSGNLNFIAKSDLRMIDSGSLRSLWNLSIDDEDPISVSKAIVLQKDTILVAVDVADLFSALVSWRITAKLSTSTKASRIPSIPRTTLGRHTISIDLGSNNPASLSGTESGIYNSRLLQDKAGLFRLAYNNVAQGWDTYGIIGMDPDIYIIISEDGEQWSNPYNLSINSMDSDIKPSFIQDRDGIFWLSWLSGRGDDNKIDMWISSSRDCKNWTKARKIKSGLRGPPDRSLQVSWHTLFQDCYDEYWIIFENADLYAIHSSNCFNWSEPINITRTNISGDKRLPVAFQDLQGVYRVVWGSGASKDRFVTMAKSRDGINWNIEKTEFNIPNERLDMNFFSFAKDNIGHYILLFNLAGLKYSMSDDCKTWSGLKQIETKKRATWEITPDLFQDNHGQFWLVPRTTNMEHNSLLKITNQIE